MLNKLFKSLCFGFLLALSVFAGFFGMFAVPALIMTHYPPGATSATLLIAWLFFLFMFIGAFIVYGEDD